MDTQLGRPIAQGSFSVSVQCDGEWLLVSIVGELDIATASIVEDSLYPYDERDEPILFVLSEVSFADVAGIAPIVKRCRNGAHIASLSPGVSRLLYVLGDRFQVAEWLTGPVPPVMGV
jgi:anti-anti-sigma factor